MKDRIKFFLQNLFGFKTYLFLFSKFKIASLKWDKKENHFLHFLQLMPDNGIILDVGANIGIMTAWLAKEKPNAQVVSFEPIKENFEVLTDIVKDGKFKNVSLRNIALGKENGNLTMIMPVIKNAKQCSETGTMKIQLVGLLHGGVSSLPHQKHHCLYIASHAFEPVVG